MFPNLFSKKPLPKKIPPHLEKIIKQLKKSKTKEQCLKKAYDILTKNYKGFKFNLFKRLSDLFVQDIANLSKRKGEHFCQHLDYIMRIVLVKSGFFKDEDIEQKITLFWYFSLHQYLRIKINKNKYINIDIWSKRYGIRFGDYAHGFNVSPF